MNLTDAKQLEIEFISQLAKVTMDGEITGEEIWHLAHWLNDHPQAMEYWPGNQFREPLQNAFSDGKLEEHEIAELAKLIVSTEKSWFQYENTEKQIIKSFNDPKAIEFSTSGIALPVIPFEMDVSCLTTDKEYKVKLDQHTCECADWIRNRSVFPSGSVQRMCKHVAHAFVHGAYNREMFPIPSWLEAFASHRVLSGRGVNITAKWARIQLEKPALISYRRDSEWVDVIAPHEETYARFNYSYVQNRWAYGLRPIDSNVISRAIEEYVTTCNHF